MARTKYNILDGVSGKFGSLVGSRNKAGGYLRARVKPVNPRTDKQQTARLGFRTAGKLFSALSQELQGGWLNFAKLFYNPLKKKNVGQYTGAQAYTGISATIFSAGAQTSLTSFTEYGGVAPISGITFNLMTVNDGPPLSSVSPNIVDTADTAAGYILNASYLDSSYILTGDFAFNGYQGAGLTNGQFVDNKGNKYGFGAYLSSPVKFQGARPGSQYAGFLGFSKLPVKAAGIVNGAHGVRIQMDVTANLAGAKRQPTVGQWFMVTWVLIAENGTVAKLDSTYVQFGTAAAAIPA